MTLDGEVVRGAWVEGGRGGRGFLAPRREVKEAEGARGRDRRARWSNSRRARAKWRPHRGGALAIKQTEDAIHDAEKEPAVPRPREDRARGREGARDRKSQVIDVELKQAESERGAGDVRIAEIDKELQAAETSACRPRPFSRTSARASWPRRDHSEEKQAVSAEARSTLAGLVEKEAATLKMKERLSAEFADLESRIENALTRSRELEEKASEGPRTASGRTPRAARGDPDRTRSRHRRGGQDEDAARARAELDAARSASRPTARNARSRTR